MSGFDPYSTDLAPSVLDVGQDQQPIVPVEPDPIVGDKSLHFAPPMESGSPGQALGQPAEELQTDGPTGEGGVPARSPAPVDIQAVTLPEHMSPEEAYGASKYFQSKYDALANETKDLRENSDLIRAQAHLLTRVQSDPSLLANLAGGTEATAIPNAPVGVNGQVAPAAALVMPEKPERPADDYGDEYDTWVAKNDTYNSDMAAYNQGLLNQGLGEIHQFMENQRRAAEAASVVTELQHEHSLSRTDAADLAQMVQSGTLFQDPNIIAEAFKLTRARSRQVNGQSAESLRAHQAQQAARERTHRLPATAAATQGAAHSTSAVLTESQPLDPWK